MIVINKTTGLTVSKSINEVKLKTQETYIETIKNERLCFSTKSE